MSRNFEIVDAHTHIPPEWAGLAVRVMDRTGIACSVTLGWMDAFGPRLDHMLSVFGRWPGRFAQLTNIDWSRVDRPDFGAAAADELERGVERGARGLKIFKSLGLEVRTADGQLLRVDDHRLDPVFERAGRLGVPVLIHVADPPAFWEPLGQNNFWSGVLVGAYAEWSYYRKNLPSREELLGERDTLFERHRGTVFVAPHMASMADDPLALEEQLEHHPNMYVDISARLPAMARNETRRRHWRDLCIRWSERVLFGTDLIYDNPSVASGIQSQSFQRPEDVDIRGLAPEEAYEKTSAEYVDCHMRFLLWERTQPTAPFRRQAGHTSLPGLGLPDEVVQRIVHDNPLRVYHLEG
ncbi:amidohydrolase [bacterium]|nr:amidohydrolase [bacterium]